MLSIGCAFLDPLAQQIDLLFIDRFVLVRRWHDIIRILRRNAADQLAGFRISRDNGNRMLVRLCDGSLAGIQTHFRLALVLIRTMTVETMLAEDRLNVPGIVDLRRLPLQGSQENECREERLLMEEGFHFESNT